MPNEFLVRYIDPTTLTQPIPTGRSWEGTFTVNVNGVDKIVGVVRNLEDAPQEFLNLPDASVDGINGEQLVLPEIKNQLISKINAKAGELRKQLLTNIFGQELVVQEKYDEATSFLADPNQSTLLNEFATTQFMTGYPWLSREAVAKQTTPDVIANEIVTAKSTWVDKGSQIEQFRIQGITEVTNATTVTQAETAYQNAINSLNSIVI